MVYGLKINYSKKSIGQKCIDYIGPKSLCSLNIKINKYLRPIIPHLMLINTCHSLLCDLLSIL